jgi:hypothetical protein
MMLSRSISNEDAERVLGGARTGPGPNGTLELGELAAFVRAVGATVPTQPDPDLEARLVPRLATTAAGASSEAAQARTAALRSSRPERAPRRRMALAGRAAIAVAAVPLLTAGLAVAGAKLPEAATTAFERVGINLPNQAAEKADSNGGGKGHRGDRGANGKSSGAKSGSEGGQAQDNGSRGNSENAPGQLGTAPGLREETPGQSDDVLPPGQGGTPPGLTFEPASPQGSNAPSSPPGESQGP